jgi:ubiquinone/menaquinone biosynthesis C-methylase UbiE
MSQQVSYKSYPGTAAENYERYFLPVIGAPVAADLVDAAALRRGQRVVDVACGTGVVARLAVARVGPAGTVTGVDVTPGMLAVARSISADGPPIEWHEASADKLPLPDASADVVLCSLGLQFFPDRAAALREMRRVLIPGGQLAVNAPGPIPPLFTVLHDAVGEHLGPGAAAFVRAVFSLHGADEIRLLLADSGFDGIDVAVRSMRLTLPAPADFLWQYILSTPLVASVASLNEDRRAALERDVVKGWQPYIADDGMLLALEIAVGTAHA